MYYTKTLSDGTTVTSSRMREICEAQPDGVYRPAKFEGHQTANGAWFVVSPRGTTPTLATGRAYGSRDDVQAFVDRLNS